jgi:hypothetical protein
LCRPAVNKAVNAFKESIYGPDYEQAEAEAAAQQNKPSEAARKRKADADAAKSQQADYDWKKLAESGKVGRRFAHGRCVLQSRMVLFLITRGY